MKTYEAKISQQPSEIDALIGVFVAEGVRSFLEIGSRFGGSLWRIGTALPRGSKIVSVDSGVGMGGHKPGAQESLRECVTDLVAAGYDAHLVLGNSHKMKIIERVRKMGPFDAVFIDGDHELKGVTLDWKNYGMAARLVAFHDVGWQRPRDYKNEKLVEVPALWEELKLKYRSEQFVDRSGGFNMGIGVLWR